MRRLSTDEALTEELERLHARLAGCRDDGAELATLGSELESISARLRELAIDRAVQVGPRPVESGPPV